MCADPLIPPILAGALSAPASMKHESTYRNYSGPENQLAWTPPTLFSERNERQGRS